MAMKVCLKLHEPKKLGTNKKSLLISPTPCKTIKTPLCHHSKIKNLSQQTVKKNLTALNFAVCSQVFSEMTHRWTRLTAG